MQCPSLSELIPSIPVPAAFLSVAAARFLPFRCQQPESPSPVHAARIPHFPYIQPESLLSHICSQNPSLPVHAVRIPKFPCWQPESLHSRVDSQNLSIPVPLARIYSWAISQNSSIPFQCRQSEPFHSNAGSQNPSILMPAARTLPFQCWLQNPSLPMPAARTLPF
jgi:hypothetical protein